MLVQLSVLTPSLFPPPRNRFIHYIAHAIMDFLLSLKKEAWAGVEYSECPVPLKETKFSV